jgi:hypothetical protein
LPPENSRAALKNMTNNLNICKENIKNFGSVG